MKKMIILIFTCSLLLCLAGGCADVANVPGKGNAGMETISNCNMQVVETAATEEGYYILEGCLHEIGKHDLVLELEEGGLLQFHLAPETIIYAGDGKEIEEGQMIRIVFDMKDEEIQTEKALVIAVSTLEEM